MYSACIDIDLLPVRGGVGRHLYAGSVGRDKRFWCRMSLLLRKRIVHFQLTKKLEPKLLCDALKSLVTFDKPVHCDCLVHCCETNEPHLCLLPDNLENQYCEWCHMRRCRLICSEAFVAVVVCGGQSSSVLGLFLYFSLPSTLFKSLSLRVARLKGFEHAVSIYYVHRLSACHQSRTSQSFISSERRSEAPR
jgi:hypothetical protein